MFQSTKQVVWTNRVRDLTNEKKKFESNLKFQFLSPFIFVLPMFQMDSIYLSSSLVYLHHFLLINYCTCVRCTQIKSFSIVSIHFLMVARIDGCWVAIFIFNFINYFSLDLRVRTLVNKQLQIINIQTSNVDNCCANQF